MTGAVFKVFWRVFISVLLPPVEEEEEEQSKPPPKLTASRPPFDEAGHVEVASPLSACRSSFA